MTMSWHPSQTLKSKAEYCIWHEGACSPRHSQMMSGHPTILLNENITPTRIGFMLLGSKRITINKRWFPPKDLRLLWRGLARAIPFVFKIVPFGTRSGFRPERLLLVETRQFLSREAIFRIFAEDSSARRTMFHSLVWDSYVFNQKVDDS